MVAWHHQLDVHEFEQAPGVGDGQGSLACSSPWGHKEPDTTERLNRTENVVNILSFQEGQIKNISTAEKNSQITITLHIVKEDLA